MNRDYPEDRDEYNRLDADLSEKDPADVEDDETDTARRGRLTSIIDSVEPQEKTPVGADAVYGDTDIDPNRDDERDAHHGEGDTV